MLIAALPKAACRENSTDLESVIRALHGARRSSLGLSADRQVYRFRSPLFLRKEPPRWDESFWNFYWQILTVSSSLSCCMPRLNCAIGAVLFQALFIAMPWASQPQQFRTMNNLHSNMSYPWLCACLHPQTAQAKSKQVEASRAYCQADTKAGKIGTIHAKSQEWPESSSIVFRKGSESNLRI